MRRAAGRKLSYLLLFIAFAGGGFYYFLWQTTTPTRISEFGRYQGYADGTYDGVQRLSDYLTLANGTRLAYDIYLPTRKGVPAAEPLPALFKYTPYGRTWTIFDENGDNNFARLIPLRWYEDLFLRIRARLAPNGNRADQLWRTKWLRDMVHDGYVVVAVDRPGTGASFGKLAFAPELGIAETDELLDWIAAQKWSNGRIGMYGDSIQAQIQFIAAATGNPHLKAILPATTWMDNYSSVMFPGGVRDKAFTDFYVRANRAFDALATPVDRDTDGALLAQARRERRAASLADVVESLPTVSFRDMQTANGKLYWEEYHSLYPLLERINRAGVPVYLINGWYDLYARDNFLIYANLTVPKRLLVRPVDHSEIEAPGPDVNIAAEAHRWFDYWLKGIDNGIARDPPIHYYVIGEDKKRAWRAANAWPPSDAAPTHYYLGSQGSGPAPNHKGVLALRAPSAGDARDDYVINYSTTTGPKPRWSAPAAPHEYPNMRSNDAKALTYTTPPLPRAVSVAGHPVVHLWLSTDAPDLDVFAYLEEVDPDGNSTYVTEGILRASLRALARAPFENLGLPFHSYFQSDVKPIPEGEAVELVFDLFPVAHRFRSGNRLRLAIAGADAGNFDTPVIEPAPTVRVLRDARHPSFVDLPVLLP
jgi:putative CocE/NonD family hydrolase